MKKKPAQKKHTQISVRLPALLVYFHANDITADSRIWKPRQGNVVLKEAVSCQ